MERKKWVAGNWKMNGGLAANEDLIRGFSGDLDGAVDVSVFCPFPYLLQVSQLTQALAIQFGAQDVSAHSSGAYTGDVSAAMLKELGAAQVIVGHSERRTMHQESSQTVGLKARAAIDAGLFPLVCVGETLAQREAGEVQSILASQLDPIIEHTASHAKGGVWSLAIAYEPVWAIGTGLTATPDQAQDAHRLIRSRIAAALGEEVAQSTRILYGGSVKPTNAAEIFSQTDIDGGLIGGASLKSGDFSGIIRAARV